VKALITTTGGMLCALATLPACDPPLSSSPGSADADQASPHHPDGQLPDRYTLGEGASEDTDDPGPSPILDEHDLASADYVMLGSEAMELAGSGLAALGDLDGDSLDDFAVAAPELGSWDGFLGGAYVLRAPPPGTWRLPAADILIEGTTEQQWLGTTIAPVWDMDGDGVHELMLGSPDEDGAQYGQGGAYLFTSAQLGPGDYELFSDEAYAIVRGSLEHMEMGCGGDGRGDLNGDGVGDLLVGSEDDLWIYMGPISGESYEYDADAALHAGSEYSTYGGGPTHAGDLDGDGLGDLATHYFIDGEYSVFLHLGPFEGHRSQDDAHAVLLPEAEDYLKYLSLSGGHDLDGDGLDDLAIGAPRNDNAGENAGAVHILTSLPEGEFGIGDARAVVYGPDAHAEAGAVVDASGDVDGDGQLDLLAGAPSFQDARGAAFLVYGPFTGTYSMSDGDVMMRGMTEGGTAGAAVAHAGDIDGDGLGDILVGAPLDDTNGEEAGAAFLVLGASLP